MDSILISVKKMLGIESEYTHFDQDIIIHINTALGILTQLGVGPVDGYSISDAENTWDEFLTGSNLEMVKTYVYLKVRLLFDPPQSSITRDAIQNNLEELTWRINVTVDPGKEKNNV